MMWMHNCTYDLQIYPSKTQKKKKKNLAWIPCEWLQLYNIFDQHKEKGVTLVISLYCMTDRLLGNIHVPRILFGDVQRYTC